MEQTKETKISFFSVVERISVSIFTFIFMDLALFLMFIGLSIFGILMIYSSSTSLEYFYGISPQYYMIKMIIFNVLAFIVFLAIISFPFNKIKKLGPYILIGNVVALISVLLFGKVVNGARSWFDLGFMSIQPIEFVKIGLIISFAWYFEENRDTATNFNIQNLHPKKFMSSIYFPLAYLAFICGLLLLQPDLGGTLVVFAIGMIMIAISGVKIRDLAIFSAIGLTILALVISIIAIFNLDVIPAYQMDRIRAWINPFKYQMSLGFQVVNSYVAIANGGLFGTGLGDSIQKLGYIPESYTDFIGAIIAEELGLIGITILILVYSFVVYRLFKYAFNQQKISQAMFLVGFGTLLFVQLFINLAGITGIIPLTGITLPFISYGGSSLLSLYIGIGIVCSITAKQNIEKQKSTLLSKITKKKNSQE